MIYPIGRRSVTGTVVPNQMGVLEKLNEKHNEIYWSSEWIQCVNRKSLGVT